MKIVGWTHKFDRALFRFRLSLDVDTERGEVGGEFWIKSHIVANVTVDVRIAFWGDSSQLYTNTMTGRLEVSESVSVADDVPLLSSASKRATSQAQP